MAENIIKKYINTIDCGCKRKAAYIRVSSKLLGQESSYNNQINYWRGKLSDNGVNDVLFYSDKVSGCSIDRRQGLKDLLDDVRKGKISEVHTKSISRLSRNMVDAINIVKELIDCQVPIFFEKENINTLNMQSHLIFNIIARLAEYERESISQNCRWASEKKFQRGLPRSFNQIYGYSVRKMENGDAEYKVKPEEAVIVKKIFDWYINGFGLCHIRTCLYREGIKSPTGKEMWGLRQISYMLRNRVYVGDLVLHKYVMHNNVSLDNLRHRLRPVVIVENHHEAIISNDIYERTQGITAKRAEDVKIVRDSDNIFSQKIKCCDCGRSFILSKRKNKKGLQKYWSCGKKDKLIKTLSICNTYSISEEKLVKYVFMAKDEYNENVRNGETKKQLDQEMRQLLDEERRLLLLANTGTQEIKDYEREIEEKDKLINQKNKEIRTYLLNNVFIKETDIKEIVRDHIDRIIVGHNRELTIIFNNGYSYKSTYHSHSGNSSFETAFSYISHPLYNKVYNEDRQMIMKSRRIQNRMVWITSTKKFNEMSISYKKIDIFLKEAVDEYNKRNMSSFSMGDINLILNRIVYSLADYYVRVEFKSGWFIKYRYFRTNQTHPIIEEQGYLNIFNEDTFIGRREDGTNYSS